MTIKRNNNLGYASWTIVDNDDNYIVTFDTYYDAVDFIRCMNGDM